MALHYLGTNVDDIFANKEMFFYQYDSPLVIGEAVGLMMAFAKTNIIMKDISVKGMMKIFVNASLVVYLIHMHPIIKKHYVSIGVLSWINVCNFGIYILEMLFCVGAVFLIGIGLSVPVTKFSSVICCKLENKLEKFNEK